MLTYVMDACREVGCDRRWWWSGFEAQAIRAAYIYLGDGDTLARRKILYRLPPNVLTA